jgi:RNA recognition motif-containing protein
MKIYIGNLSLETSETQLRSMFAPHGAVKSAKLAMDRDTGKPRGFGFVEMDDASAKLAIAALHGTGDASRPLKVNEAKPRPTSGGPAHATPVAS